MPVGCFPSFRKSLKKFSKGRAPLPKKENNSANGDGSDVKPEVNNCVDVKASISAKLEELPREETALSHPEGEAAKQNQEEAAPNSEQMSQYKQPASCLATCGEVCPVVLKDDYCQSVPNEAQNSDACKSLFLEEQCAEICLSAPSEVDVIEDKPIFNDEATVSGDGGVLRLAVDEHLNSHDTGSFCEFSVCRGNVQQPSEPDVFLELELPCRGADIEECTMARMSEDPQAATEPEAHMTKDHEGILEDGPKQEAEMSPECTVSEPAEANEDKQMVQEMKKVREQPVKVKDVVLPKGFSWKTISYPLPAGAIDIHELHFPIHIGLIETSQGEFPCKFLERNKSFYAGIDGLEEDFAWGKILCLDPAEADSIELEWVHVSDSELKTKNLIVGARDKDGKPMYIARGMVPPTGRFPNYELSSGWVSEELQEARLAFLGVEWRQPNFDVLTWKPSRY